MRTGRPAERGGTIASLRRRNSQVRHSGPVHRTPDIAGGFGILNELRHIGECFWVALRHRDLPSSPIESPTLATKSPRATNEAASAAARPARRGVQKFVAMPSQAEGDLDKTIAEFDKAI